jgi:anti-anti-sigma regulatory factor
MAWAVLNGSGDMLRITENCDDGSTVRIRLDGTISLESFAELDEALACHQNSPRKTIIIDMAGVDFMKDEAARKLVNLQSEALSIINCSPFIATLLETLRRLSHET